MLNKKMFMMAGMMMTVMMIGVFVVGGGVFMQGKIQTVKADLSVGIASDQISVQTVSAGQKDVEAAKFQFRTYENGVVIENFSLKATGTFSNPAFTNIRMVTAKDNSFIAQGLDSGSYINFNVQKPLAAGSSMDVKILVDISNVTSSGSFSFEVRTVKGKNLVSNKNIKVNLIKDTKGSLINVVAAAGGNAISLTVSSDTAYGAQTVVAGASNVKIGSFNIKGSSAENVNVTSIALLVDNAPNSNTVVSNLKLFKGADNTGLPLGSTQATVNDNSAMTISVSGLQLEKGQEIQVSAYADISSSFYDAGTLIITISAAGVSGTGQTSLAAASGPTTALTLQTITVVTSGTLTIALADDNPVTKILVAGTQYTSTGADVAKFKLSANKAEDIYLKRLALRTDTNADDSAISGAVLYGSTDSTQLGTMIGTLASMQSDGSVRAGFISWDWSGSSRPKVPSNSSYFITVKVNVVSSGQLATVSSLTPVIQLADVEAEGASAITPKNNALDQTPTIIVLGTFAPPTTATDLAAALTATADTITLGSNSNAPAANATGNGMLDNDQGYYCYIGTTGYPFAGGTEMFYVMGEDTPVTAGIYQIERGIFNTTAAAVTPAGDDENIFCVAAPKGNIIQILNTKLTATTDTTGLDTAAKTEMKLAKIKFSADANISDAAENKATITKMRITVTANNADASSFVMYPEEKYNDASYAVTGKYVADSVVEFRFDDANADGTVDNTFSSTVYDDVVEGQSRTYTIKANVVVGTNGSLDIQLAKTGNASTAAYGSSTGSDISWTDGATSPTISAWLNQPGITSVSLRDFSSASSTGTPDTTAPALSSVTATTANTAGVVEASDVVSFTFSEAMSQVTFTDVKMLAAGTITADFTPQAVADGTLFKFANSGTATFTGATPSWWSSTVFRIMIIGGISNPGGDPEGQTTPSSTLFMDVFGNAGVTGTPALAANSW